MPDRLSGVEAISPAIERCKRQLFQPFRYGHWMRLATLCLLTGELTGGGGPSGLLNFELPARRRSGADVTRFIPLPDWHDPRLLEFWPWVVAGVVMLLVLALAFVYVASVFRFVLFDAVLYNRCELMKGWRRWQRQGSSYFLWLIGFGLASLAAMIVLIGGPVYLAWIAGVFAQPGDHLASLLLGGVLLFFLAVCLILASGLGALFAKDFVVPVMALEDLGVLEGWRRVLPMLAAEKGPFAIYVLMKIVLAVGSALLFGIVDFMVILGLLIPVGILAAVVIVVGGAAGLTWNTATICAAVGAGGLVLMALIFVVSFVSAPAMVFFQAYSLHFLGSRYPALGDQLTLTTPRPAPSAPTPPAAAPFPAF